jgi:hypothetical protein
MSAVPVAAFDPIFWLHHWFVLFSVIMAIYSIN